MVDNKNFFKQKILIDLDGVLNTYDGNFDKYFIPPLKNGAKEFLEKLNKKFDLYLFTSRNLLLASKWLIENNLDKFFKDVTNTKIPAFLYIDDRALKFNGNFIETFKEIENLQIYWKK